MEAVGKDIRIRECWDGESNKVIFFYKETNYLRKSLVFNCEVAGQEEVCSLIQENFEEDARFCYQGYALMNNFHVKGL